MRHQSLDIYDDMPEAMQRYISNFGWHFNKKACSYAIGQMKRKNPVGGKMEAIEPWTKEQVEALLVRNGVTLDNCVMYDATYVANMAKADYYKSSITDEPHLALYIKDVLDDADGSDELPFRYWLQKCVAMGEPVEFEDFM